MRCRTPRQRSDLDTAVIGFAARVQASGARRFTIHYHVGGRQRRMTIGRSPDWRVPG